MSTESADNFVDDLLPDPLPPWAVVAKKEVLDAVRTWQFLGLLVFFSFMTLAPIIGVIGLNLLTENGQPFQQTTTVIRMLDELISVLVPLIAVMLGYGSITKEHQSGSLKLLMSLPISRRDVVLGKFLGRSTLTTIPVLVGMVGSLVLFLIGGFEIDFAVFTAFVVYTVFLGVVFTGVSTGISAAVSTNFRAVFASLITYMGLAFAWGVGVINIVPRLLEHLGIGETSRLTFMLFGQLLNPTSAYQSLLNSAVFGPMTGRVLLFPSPGGLFALIPGFEAINRKGCTAVLGGTVETTQTGSRCVGNAVALWYTDVATVLYMSLWIAIPLGVGYYLFQNRDL